MFKEYILTAVLLAMTTVLYAQTADSTVFRAYLYNNEYNVFMRINFYDADVMVPGQDIYGPLPGYFQKELNSFSWLITDAEITSPATATLQMINDYGSEDLTAELECVNDSIYMLRHRRGSVMKVPNNGKWQKLPKAMELKRKK